MKSILTLIASLYLAQAYMETLLLEPEFADILLEMSPSVQTSDPNYCPNTWSDQGVQYCELPGGECILGLYAEEKLQRKIKCEDLIDD